MFNAQKVKDDCVQWIRDFFEANGPGCNAVIGIYTTLFRSAIFN